MSTELSSSNSFLQCGTPARCLADFPSFMETYCRTFGEESICHSQWEWLVYFPRQWCRDGVRNAVGAPAFHFLLITPTAEKEEEKASQLALVLDQTDSQPLLGTDCTLFPYTPPAQEEGAVSPWSNANNAEVFKNCSRAALGCLIRTAVHQLPEAWRPKATADTAAVTVRAVLDGTTHERIRLFDLGRWKRIERTLHSVDTALSVQLDVCNAKSQEEKERHVFATAQRIFTWADQRNTESLTSQHEEDAEERDTPFHRSNESYCSSFRDCSLPPLSSSLTKKICRVFYNRQHSPARRRNLQLFLETQYVEEDRAIEEIEKKINRYAPAGTVQMKERDARSGVPLESSAEKTQAMEEYRKARGEVLSLSIVEEEKEDPPTTTTTTTAAYYRHWLLRQLPLHLPDSRTPHSYEPTDANGFLHPTLPPFSPCPTAVELHCFRDAGDLLYLNDNHENGHYPSSYETSSTKHRSVLQNPSLFVNQGEYFHLEDYLRSNEGEWYLQLKGVEGVSFSNIDTLLEVWEEAEGAPSSSLQVAPPPPSHSNSTCGLRFPFFFQRDISTESVKVNPIAKPTLELLYRSVEEEREKEKEKSGEKEKVIHQFIEDLEWFLASQLVSLKEYYETYYQETGAQTPSSTVTIPSHEWNTLGAPGYTILLGEKSKTRHSASSETSSPKQILSPPSIPPYLPSCQYCHRTLLSRPMPRCSRCRVAYYCCPLHQQYDWKGTGNDAGGGGSHKQLCGYYKSSQAFWEKHVRPYFEQQQQSSVKGEHKPRRSKMVSLANTILSWMEAYITTQNFSSSSPPPPHELHFHIVFQGYKLNDDTGEDDKKRIMDGAESATGVQHLLEEVLHGLQSARYPRITEYLSKDPNHSIRVLCCSDAFTAVHGQVYSLPLLPNPNNNNNNNNNHNEKDGKPILLPPSSTIGDTWHLGNSSSPERIDTCMLFRFSSSKYYHLEIEPYTTQTNNHNNNNNSSSNHCSKNRLDTPQAVLFFSPSSGDGVSFFCGTLPVLLSRDTPSHGGGSGGALNFLFHVPIRIVDSSYVGSCISRDVVLKRLRDQGVTTTDLSSAYHNNNNQNNNNTQRKEEEVLEIQFNPECAWGDVEVEEEEDGEHLYNNNNGSSMVNRKCINGFYFDV